MISSPDSRADRGMSIRNDQRSGVGTASNIPSSSLSLSSHPDTTIIAHGSFPILETISLGLQSRLPSLLVHPVERVFPESVWNSTVPHAMGPSSMILVEAVGIFSRGTFGVLFSEFCELHPPPQAVRDIVSILVTATLVIPALLSEKISLWGKWDILEDRLRDGNH